MAAKVPKIAKTRTLSEPPWIVKAAEVGMSLLEEGCGRELGPWSEPVDACGALAGA